MVVVLGYLKTSVRHHIRDIKDIQIIFSMSDREGTEDLERFLPLATVLRDILHFLKI